MRRHVIKSQSNSANSTGIFSGTVQPGMARKKRAHALAEELLERGCMFIQTQVWDEAAREFRKAIKMEPDYAEAYNNLGLCMLYAGKPEEAKEALESALQHLPNWNIAEANLALALSRTKHHKDAADLYRKSLEKKPQASIWLALGDELAAMQKPEEALEAYQAALTAAPQYDIAFHRIGMVQARRNNINEAQAALSRALEINPDNDDAAAVLGAIAARQGNLNAAGDYFSKLQKSEIVPAVAQRGMQRMQSFRQGLHQGFDEWKAGKPKAEPIATCYYNLGLALLSADNKAEAQEAFQRAVKAQPDWPEPQIALGFFAAMHGEGLIARKNWEGVSKLQPDNGMLREQLGYLAIAMGLLSEANAHFKKAIELGRNIPEELLKSD